jgi:hypothetical protein
MYGIWMSFSPTENPSTADDYTTFATSSLRKWGAEKQNPLAIGRLSKLQLGGRGWMIDHLGLPRGEYWANGLASDTDQL